MDEQIQILKIRKNTIFRFYLTASYYFLPCQISLEKPAPGKWVQLDLKMN